MDLKDVIISQEKELLSSEVRHNEKRLRQLISVDFQEIGSKGNIFGLSQAMEWLMAEKRWSAIISNIEYRLLSSSVAQMVYHAKITRDSEDKASDSVRTSLWKFEDENWKMIWHQGTAIEHKKS